jgi:alpha-tubulin suppressor-like RCC1 family protein
MTIGGNNTPAGGAAGREHNTPTYTSLTLQTDLTGTLPVNYGSTILAADRLVFPSGGLSTTSTIDDFRRNFNQLATDFNTEIDSLQLQITRNDTDLGVVATKLGEHDADLIATAKDLDQRAFRNLLINTGAGLSGGGDLESDRDLVLNIATTSERGGVVSANTATSAAHIKVESAGTMTVLDDAIALGTKTTGNYVAEIADSGSTDIIVNNSGTETALVTLGLTNTVASQTSSFLGGLSGNTVTLPKIKFDTRGRITGKGTATFQSANNSSINVNGVNGLTGTNNFTLNQTGGATLQISHANIASGVTDKLNSPNDITAYNDTQSGTDIVHHTFPIIRKLGVDAYGHIDELITTDLTYGLSNSPRGGYAAGGEYHINVPRESDFMQVEKRVTAMAADINEKIELVGGVATISKPVEIDNNLVVDGGNFTIENGGTEQFKVTNSSGEVQIAGDVGIGITGTPLAPLHIDQTTGGEPALVLQGADPTLYFYDDTNPTNSMKLAYNGSSNAGLEFRVFNNDTSAIGLTALAIDTLGNLTSGNDIIAGGNISGHGASLTGTLVVAGDSALNGNVDITSKLRHHGDTDTYLEFTAGGNIQLVNEGNTGVHVNASGQVGIGTSSISHKLDVDGTLRATGAITGDSNLTVSGNLTANGSTHTIGNAATDSVTLSTNFTFHKEAMKITGMNDYSGNDTPAGDNYRVSLRTFEPGDLDNGNKTPIHGSGTTSDYIVYEKLDGNADRADGGFAWYSTALSNDNTTFNTEQWMRLKHNEFLVNQPLVVGSSSAAKNLTVSGNTNISGNLTVDGTLDAEGITVGGALDTVTSLGLTGALTSTDSSDASSATDATAAISTDGGLAVTKKGFFGQALETAGAFTSGGTITGTTFSGSGASLTNLPATSLTGTINKARLPSATDITSVGTISSLTTTGTTTLQGDVTVGTADLTDENLIQFNGTTSDALNHTVLANRIYEAGTEKSELLFFKGNDSGTAPGPDRIRHRAAQHVFQTYTSRETYTGGSADAALGDDNTRLIITTAGEVGIGTDAPGHKLHVQGTHATDSIRAFVENTSTGQASLDLQNSEGHFRLISDAGQFRIYDQTDAAERLSIQSTGRVGIGVAAASHALEVRNQGDIAIYHTEPEIRFYETDLTGVNNNPYRLLATGGEFRIRKSTADNGSVSGEIDFIRIQQDTDMFIGTPSNPSNAYPIAIVTNPWDSNTSPSNSYIQTGLNRFIIGAENLFTVDGRPGTNNRTIQFGVTTNAIDVVSENTDGNNFSTDTDPGDGNTNVGFCVRRIDGDDRGVINYISRQDGSCLILNTNESGNIIDLNVAGNQQARISAASGTGSPFILSTRTTNSSTILDRLSVAGSGTVHVNSQTIIKDEESAIDGDPSAVLHLRSTSSDHLRLETAAGGHLGTIDVDPSNGMYIETHGSANRVIRLRPNNTDKLVVTTTQIRVLDQLDVEDTTDSNATNTGAVIVAGGVGIAKQLRVGSHLVVNGNSILGNATSDTTTIKGSLSVADGNFDVDSSGNITDVGDITSDGQIQCTSLIQNGNDPTLNFGVFNGDLFVGDNTTTRQFAVDSTTGDIFTYGKTTTVGKLTVGTDGIEFSDGSTLTSSTLTIRGKVKKLPEPPLGAKHSVRDMKAQLHFISQDDEWTAWGGDRYAIDTSGVSREHKHTAPHQIQLPHGELADKIYKTSERSWHCITKTGRLYGIGYGQQLGMSFDTRPDGHNVLSGSARDLDFTDAELGYAIGKSGRTSAMTTTEQNDRAGNDTMLMSRLFTDGEMGGYTHFPVRCGDGFDKSDGTPYVQFVDMIMDAAGHTETAFGAIDTNGIVWLNGDTQYGVMGDGSSDEQRTRVDTFYDRPLQDETSRGVTRANGTRATILKKRCELVKAAYYPNHPTLTGADQRSNDETSRLIPFRGKDPYPCNPLLTANGGLIPNQNPALATQVATFQKSFLVGGQYGTHVALGTDGKIYTCGYGGNGQCGNNSSDNHNRYWYNVETATGIVLDNIVDIYHWSYNQYSSFGARDNLGQIWTWGYNGHNLLGQNSGTTKMPYASKIYDTTDSNKFPSHNTPAADIISYNDCHDVNHLCYIKTNETVPRFYAFGDNSSYMAGAGHTNDYPAPTLMEHGPFVTSLFKIVKIAVDGGFLTGSNSSLNAESGTTMCITTDIADPSKYRLWGAGSDSYGVLGRSAHDVQYGIYTDSGFSDTVADGGGDVQNAKHNHSEYFAQIPIDERILPLVRQISIMNNNQQAGNATDHHHGQMGCIHLTDGRCYWSGIIPYNKDGVGGTDGESSDSFEHITAWTKGLWSSND